MTPGQRADAIIEDHIPEIMGAFDVGSIKHGDGFFDVWVLGMRDPKALKVARELANTPKRRRDLEFLRTVRGLKAIAVPVHKSVSLRLARCVGGLVRDMLSADPDDGCFWVAAPVVGGGSAIEFEGIGGDDGEDG